MTRAAYLDWNATAKVRPAVIAAMAEALAEGGNPSSVHRFGRQAKRRLEQARDAVAALVGACATEVTFTSGGTEANALALQGSGRERVLVSAVEHPSVLKAVAEAELIPVDTEGRVDLAALEHLLASDSRPAIVSVMVANNETGVIQPVAQVAEIAHRHGALVHADAVQAAGKIALSMAELGADLISLSAHKLGGPQGVGALVAAHDGVPLKPLLQGGGQERRLRAGTENLPGIVGFGEAAREALEGLEGMARVTALRERLEREAQALGGTGMVLFGGNAERLPNTSCLALHGVKAELQVMALDLAGVAVSAGSACSSGKVTASHVLQAMGAAERLASCAIRVSLGWDSTEEDVEMFLAAWGKLASRAGKSDGIAA
ncbi:cysteine desulfurase family protein [Telmatospirillum sp. J64-1]|uniref:cysteine desulfurase family protein n=1 Tax=Telmatospirillum sp. J64-1 TaxID=2502183 RepID=UPI00115F4D02|nr:cysteine desulfurase family protein [Telmatospirillum sp. J64-1]